MSDQSLADLSLTERSFRALARITRAMLRTKGDASALMTEALEELAERSEAFVAPMRPHSPDDARRIAQRACRRRTKIESAS